MNYRGYFTDKNGNKYYPKTEETIIKKYSYTLGKKNAGEAGYFSIDITIPTGYKVGSIGVETGQIANSRGLQITPIYGFPYDPGTRTFYFNYYAPETQASDISLEIYILYIRV